jgi:hypothetical protein
MFKTFVKTQFAPQVIMFQEILEYWNVIFIYYGWQQFLNFSSQVGMCKTWAIAQAIINTLLSMVK